MATINTKASQPAHGRPVHSRGQVGPPAVAYDEKTSVTGSSPTALTTRWLIRPVQFRVKANAELRNAPDRLAPVVTRLPKGTGVERAGKRNRRWMPVRHGPTRGWVAERLLEKVGDPEPCGGQLTTETETARSMGFKQSLCGQPRTFRLVLHPPLGGWGRCARMASPLL
jgi:hypothetical protein